MQVADHHMEKMNSAVAVYATHPQAEEALRAFQETGFDMKKLSIVGKDYHSEEHVIGFYNAGDRMKFWGKRGAFWRTFSGMLFGSALFLIRGVGHLMVLGPLAGWIVGALGEGAVVGGLTAGRRPLQHWHSERQRHQVRDSAQGRSLRRRGARRGRRSMRGETNPREDRLSLARRASRHKRGVNRARPRMG